MDNYDDYNNFSKDQTWQQLSRPVYSDENISATSDDNIKTDSTVKRSVRSPALTFQLIICLLLLTVIYLYNSFLPENYAYLKNIYNEEMNTTVFFDGNISEFDFSNIFTSTNDEV